MPADKAQAPSSENPRSRLRGKVAVVTGGNRGIGYAIARALASDACHVVITGRDSARLQKSAAELTASARDAAKIVPVICDVRQPESVSALFAAVQKQFGQIDVLVNNAGISQPATNLQDMSLDLWRDLIDTNLTGVFLCSRAALPLMKPGSTIINNLSAAAKQLFPRYYGYTSAKMGALGFTLTLREELMSRGIRVTALMPGAAATDIWEQIMPDAPRGHMLDVENIAQAVLYAVLLPPQANLSELLLTPTAGAI